MRDLSWLDKLSDADVSALREYARYIFPGQVDDNLDFLELYCPECKDKWTVEALARPDRNDQGIRHYCWSCNYDWYEEENEYE